MKVCVLLLAAGAALGIRRATNNAEGSKCIDCPAYVKSSAMEKISTIWAKITADEYPYGKKQYIQECTDASCYCGGGKVRFGNSHNNKWSAWANLPASAKGSYQCKKDNSLFKNASSVPGWRTKCQCGTNFPKSRFMSLPTREGWILNRKHNNTLQQFMDRFSDQEAHNAIKVIHGYGSVAKVEYVNYGGHSFTGMFKDGAKHALLRPSIVNDWIPNMNLKPSIAFKMMRDGDYSSNVVAQVNLGGGVGGDFNFFHHVHSTQLPVPSGGIGAFIIVSIFAAAADETNANGVEELASAGASVRQRWSDFKAPETIFFVPDAKLASKFTSAEHDAREDFHTIPAGTKLYDVYETNFAKCNGGQPSLWKDLPGKCKTSSKKIGYIRSTSRFVSSRYGDEQLFIQHTRFKNKSGKWSRKSCVTTNGKPLPDDNVFRMSGDLKRTCTNHCPKGTKEDKSFVCPFKDLE